MFGFDGMVSTVDRAFYIADHGVDPSEFFFGHAVRAAAGDDAVVVTALIEHGGKANQIVRIHQTAWFQVFTGPAFDLGRPKTFDDIQIHGDGMVLFVQRHRRNKRRFVLRASLALSALMLAAPVNII